MNINNNLSNYNNYSNASVINSNTSTGSLTGDTISELKEGQIFEGSINSIDSNGRVTIGLANGQTMSARLDVGVSITQGQSLFFQVKSNDGSMVQIRPVSVNVESNPTLLKALDSANIMATTKSVAMVNYMMQESMPINAENLAEMNRLFLSHPTVNPETLVLMTKFGIPVTDENAAMFENYSNDQAAIMNDVEKLSLSLPRLLVSINLSGQEALALNNELKNIFVDKGVATELLIDNNDSGLIENEILLKNLSLQTEESNNNLNNEFLNQYIDEEHVNTNNQESINNLNSNKDVLLSETFKENISDIKDFISKIDISEEFKNEFIDKSGEIKTNITTKEFFSELSKFMSDSNLSDKYIKDIFGTKVYRQIISSIIKDEFSIKPEEITSPKALNKLYSKILSESDSLAKVIENLNNKEAETIKHSVDQIKSNINFMNSSNELYSFVQIPLKMFNQETESSLYVRQNKKNAYEAGEEITAYLHFDMEHLGSTDVFITLKLKDVNCKWNLQDEKAMTLIEKNIDILNERLAKKGFSCMMEVSCKDEKPDFVNDFLRVENTTSNLVHRYSFDMRA